MDHLNLPIAPAVIQALASRLKLVDIGANPIDGTPCYATLLEAGLTEVVGFEPNPEALARLVQMQGALETYLPHAIGDGGQHLLRFCRAPGMTSLLEPDPSVLDLFHGFPEWGEVTQTEPVQTVRLDDVAEAKGADMLKLDIQGAELMALRHARALLEGVLVIQTEVEFLPLYRDQPLFADVSQFLQAHGFIFHRFSATSSRVVKPLLVDNNIYAGLSQMVWADAVFIRDFTRPQAIAGDGLLRMAVLLHYCYGSIDVAMHLLNAYDQRQGTSLAGAYLAGLQGSNPMQAAA